MEIHFAPFDEQGRFLDAVKRGEAALERGEYLNHDQVGLRLGRFLNPDGDSSISIPTGFAP